MSLYLDERGDDSFALYLDGDLQFDTRDEALYHESLALPALTLAQRAKPEGLRVLICGGGDGLALRECLRFPGVAHADLVDYDPEVVELGRTRFADLNAHAFDDPRAHIHIADAWEFLGKAEPYDVILCDFTVPRRAEDTRVFTQEWYARLMDTLTPDGLLGLNGVSPQGVPEAYWCLRKTVRAAGLSALPYRACIPSFRAQGYGAWGFLLASPQPLTASLLHDLDCPVPTRQADLNRLWRGARFSRAERHLETQAPVHTLSNGVLLPLLLNPGLRQRELEAAQHPYDLNPLMRAIPILHPYHTRLMVETLAKQVIGTISALDLRRLVDAVLRRATALPQEIRNELTRLREFLSLSPLQMQVFGAWCGRLFAALVLLMTLANAISPDNAFAKGSFGGGHSSSSVGHSSFGGSRGFSSSSRSSGSSFSGSPGFSSSSRSGGSFGRGGASFGSSRGSASTRGSSSFGHTSVFAGRSASPTFTGSGFRNSYGHGQAVSLNGSYSTYHTFYYWNYGVYNHPYSISQGGAAPTAQAEQHQPFFIATDTKDMLVMDNGDIIITLSDSAYLLISHGTVALMSNKSPAPLMMLYPDPDLFQQIRRQLEDQGNGVEQAIGTRQDWLSWVGWTSALLPGVAGDRQELTNLQDLDKRLHTAYDNLGNPPAGATPAPAPGTDDVELFIDCRLRADGKITLRDDKGGWAVMDASTLTLAQKSPQPCPPELKAALYSVLVKSDTDNTAAIASDKNDLTTLASDLTSLQKDLSDYNSLMIQNGSSYEVDYGTDSISASDAISRTQKDIDQNAQDTKTVLADITREARLQQHLATLLSSYKPGR
ncbi:MAG: Spermidine synthase [Chthonomonadales bacterium]|nr:Spermidine synthase [Chthonomonadales bacterium]